MDKAGCRISEFPALVSGLEIHVRYIHPLLSPTIVISAIFPGFLSSNMSLSFAGHTVVITGAGGGLGKA